MILSPRGQPEATSSPEISIIRCLSTECAFVLHLREMAFFLMIDSLQTAFSFFTPLHPRAPLHWRHYSFFTDGETETLWGYVLSRSVVRLSSNPMHCSPLSSPFLSDFSGKNTGVGFHFLPGDLPKPGIEPACLGSPALAGGFFTTKPPGKPCCCC